MRIKHNTDYHDWRMVHYDIGSGRCLFVEPWRHKGWRDIALSKEHSFSAAALHNALVNAGYCEDEPFLTQSPARFRLSGVSHFRCVVDVSVVLPAPQPYSVLDAIRHEAPAFFAVSDVDLIDDVGEMRGALDRASAPYFYGRTYHQLVTWCWKNSVECYGALEPGEPHGGVAGRLQEAIDELSEIQALIDGAIGNKAAEAGNAD